MNDVARGKRNMFDAFVNKDLGEGPYLYKHSLAISLPYISRSFILELKTILQGCIPDVAIDKDTENETNETEAPPNKRRKRIRKPIVVDDEDDVPSPKACNSVLPGEGNDTCNGTLSDTTSFTTTSNRGDLPMFHDQKPITDLSTLDSTPEHEHEMPSEPPSEPEKGYLTHLYLQTPLNMYPDRRANVRGRK